MKTPEDRGQPLLAAFEHILQNPPTVQPDGFLAGVCTAPKPVPPVPVPARTPADAALSPLTSDLRPLTAAVVTQQAGMAVAQSRAEFLTARAVLAGLVAASEILLAPDAFAAAVREWDINADTLADLRAIAGLEEDQNSDAIEA